MRDWNRKAALLAVADCDRGWWCVQVLQFRWWSGLLNNKLRRSTEPLELKRIKQIEICALASLPGTNDIISFLLMTISIRDLVIKHKEQRTGISTDEKEESEHLEAYFKKGTVFSPLADTKASTVEWDWSNPGAAAGGGGMLLSVKDKLMVLHVAVISLMLLLLFMPWCFVFCVLIICSRDTRHATRSTETREQKTQLFFTTLRIKFWFLSDRKIRFTEILSKLQTGCVLPLSSV